MPSRVTTSRNWMTGDANCGSVANVSSRLLRWPIWLTVHRGIGKYDFYVDRDILLGNELYRACLATDKLEMLMPLRLGRVGLLPQRSHTVHLRRPHMRVTFALPSLANRFRRQCPPPATRSMRTSKEIQPRTVQAQHEQRTIDLRQYRPT